MTSVDEKFFPCLPHGFKPHLDMTGWVSHVGSKNDGRISLVKDLEVKASCAEITCAGDNESCAISFPDEAQFIGTPLPFFTLHIKNLNRFVTIDIEFEAKDGSKKTLKCSNHQSVVRLGSRVSSLPLELTPGWNKVVFNLPDLIGRLFKCKYKQCLRVKIHANCRLRRVFFSDANYRNADLPESLRV